MEKSNRKSISDKIIKIIIELNNKSVSDYEEARKNEDERKKVCLATITYTMPVSYEGISPIKEIFEFAFKQEVTGLEAAAPNVPDQTWNYNKQNLAGGGVNTAVTTPTSGNIYYYVVR